MTPLGKPLVFCLKYLAEMNRLDGRAESVELDLLGLSDAESVREMAHVVGAAADVQAADFVELCGREIEAHFTGLGIATVSHKRNRAFTIRNWEWGARVYVSSMPDICFSCGVWVDASPRVRTSIANDECGAVIPFLWSSGGRKAAERVGKILVPRPD